MWSGHQLLGTLIYSVLPHGPELLSSRLSQADRALPAEHTGQQGPHGLSHLPLETMASGSTHPDESGRSKAFSLFPPPAPNSAGCDGSKQPSVGPRVLTPPGGPA